LKAVDDFAVGHGSRYGVVGMMKLDCVGDDLALGVALDQFETAIQVECWPNVEAGLRREIPWSVGDGLGMDEHTTNHRSKWSPVKVKGPMEELPGQDPRVEGQLLK
jgi:hypothetical protein